MKLAKTALLVLGLLVMVAGVIWMGQGSGYFPYPAQSFMINQSPWILRGAIVAVVAAFLVSTTVGIVVVVFFVFYQQFENSVLQVVIMSRRASVNPLVVLLSLLVGVDLFGMVGALLAIPVAGALTVIVQAIWQHRPLRDDELLIVSDGSSDDGSEPSRPISLRRRVRRWFARRHTVRPG